MRKLFSLLVLLVIAGALAACNNDLTVIKVVATAVPHEEILIEAIPLLKEKGYTLDITVISDYSLGNPAVASGSADANYFQHLPYFNAYNETAPNDKKLVNAGSVHIEPIGLYGGAKSSIDAIADGDKIIISDNAPDYGRIVQFLKNIGLVTVASDFNANNPLADPEEAILTKIVNFEFKIIEAALLVTARNNNEGAYFFINGNYALEGGLGLADVLVSEPTVNNPYVNIIAVRSDMQNDEKIRALVEVLQSEHIRNFINTKYNGSVIPVN